MFELQFDSLHALFWMNGHGPYVWGSYALAVIALVFLVWSPLARRRQFFKQMRLVTQREKQQRQGAGAFNRSEQNNSPSPQTGDSGTS